MRVRQASSVHSLGRGYHQQAEALAPGEHIGSFFVRLESGGQFRNDSDIVITAEGENSTSVDTREGEIIRTHQRDSHLFQANPGETVNITVSGIGNEPLPDPMVELFDPEGFLIAANDNFSGRGKNAVIASLTLPALTGDGTEVPGPSTYRIVVSGIDRANPETQHPLGDDSIAYRREVNGGGYELKVFSGPLSGGQPARPSISGVQPIEAAPGDIVTIRGSGFAGDPGENQVMFGNARGEVLSASEEELRVSVPEGTGEGTLDVAVSVQGLTSLPFEFSVRATPPVSEEGRILAELISLSLRVPSASAEVLGETYTMKLTSRFELDAFNDELYFNLFANDAEALLSLGRDPEFFSHATEYTIFDANGDMFLAGFFEINVPPSVDTNGNGLPDFFDVGLPLEPATTSGEYFDDFLDSEGTIEAEWSRPAGSRTGRVTLTFPLDAGGFVLEAEFQADFELLTYEGEFAFQRNDGSAQGDLDLTLSNELGLDLDPSLNGEILLELRDEDSANLQAGNLSSSDEAERPFDEVVSWRSGARFISRIKMDWEESAGKGGYFDWLLVLQDDRDSDGDGVPDISDADFVPGAGNGGGEILTFVQWRQNMFSAAELNDPENEATVWGFGADPDRDGLANALEQHLGLSPMNRDNISDVLHIELASGEASLVHQRSKRADPSAGFVEWSGELNGWSTTGTASEVISETAETELVRVKLPADAEFARIVVEQR